MLILLLACAGDPAASKTDAPTWAQDVAPIVAEHCASCHVDGGIAPFALDSYETSSAMAGAMVAAVESGSMPPWSARSTDECTPRQGWKDDLRLSDEELDTLRAWADADAPEGDTSTAAEIPEPPSLDLDRVDLSLTPDRGYVAEGSSDTYQCFSLDPELTSTSWLKGVQVVPGNNNVVHHVLVYSDPYGESPELAEENGYYPCFGGSGVQGSDLLMAWVPGATAFITPESSAMKLTPESRIVMQIHYHPSGEAETEDRTTVQLRWADQLPETTTYLSLIGNASTEADGLLPGPNDRTSTPEFLIPADVAGHTEEMDVTLGDIPDVNLFLVGTHLHLVGTGMRIGLTRNNPQGDEPSEECLIETPEWDFDWQRAYSYDGAGIRIAQGDTLHLRCEYDNTLDNPGVVRLLEDIGEDAPFDVQLGEATEDEMCLGIFGVTY